MYLFVFAFLGNVFYVASILTSPKISLPPPESTEFIKETIPYVFFASLVAPLLTCIVDTSSEVEVP